MASDGRTRTKTDNLWESHGRTRTKTANPWKNDRGEKTEKIKKERKFLEPLEGGHIAMSFGDFKDNCQEIFTSDDFMPV